MLMMVVVVLGGVDDVIGGLLMVMIDLICLRSPISVAFCFQLPLCFHGQMKIALNHPYRTNN